MSDAPESVALFIAKSERRGPVSVEARAALMALPTRTIEFPAYRNIVNEGDRPTHSSFVQEGLVSRYMTLRNGSRQIVSFHIPGDMVDLQSALVVVADHGIRTHVATTIVSIPHAAILTAAAQFPELARAFWFDTLIDAAIFREWTLNVGRRNARQRTAHLLMEFAYRFQVAGMLVDDSFQMPVTQADMSDATGMTAVHFNRTFQTLRADRLIRTHAKTVWIEDWDGMRDLAGFDPVYLHPEGPRTL